MLKLASNLELPLKAVTERFALLGRTGAGKSYGTRVLAEELLDADQFVIVVDPKGDWWGVRSSYDGRKGGYPVLIMGGEHGDVPLQPGSGKFVAEFLTAERVSTVLDLSDFEEQQMYHFVADLGKWLYQLSRGKRLAAQFILDEADEFAPQSGMAGQAAHSLGAMQRLQRRGRGRGWGLSVLTQRSQSIHKGMISQAGTLIAMQLSHPKDIEPVENWLSANASPQIAKEVVEQLSHLAEGEAFICSPKMLGRKAIKFRFRKIRTFDSMRTPEPGEAQAAPKKLAEVNLKSVEKQMAATIAEAKANDPKELKEEIARLNQELKKKVPAAAAAPATKETRVEVPVLKDKQIAQLTKIYNKMIAEAERHGKAMNLLWADQLEQAQGMVAALRSVSSGAPAKPPLKVFQEPSRKAQTAAVSPDSKPAKRQVHEFPEHVNPRSAEGEPAGEGNAFPPAVTFTASEVTAPDGQVVKMGPAERKILTAFYWLRDQQANESLVSFYSTYSASSSTWDRALGALRHGWVTGWSITEAGMALVESWKVKPKPKGMQLRAWLRSRLDKADNEILDVLIAKYPHRLTSEELGQAANRSTNSSTWDRAIGRLRSIKAAEGYDKDGGIKAADVFFT